jgi:hypothetical protein
MWSDHCLRITVAARDQTRGARPPQGRGEAITVRQAALTHPP